MDRSVNRSVACQHRTACEGCVLSSGKNDVGLPEGDWMSCVDSCARALGRYRVSACARPTPQKSPDFGALVLPGNLGTSSFFSPFYRQEVGPREADALLLLLLLKCFEGSSSCRSCY